MDDFMVEGYAVASAPALAGLESLLESGKIGAEETTLIALTGFGFKDRIP